MSGHAIEKAFGEAVRDRRKALGLSQAELAFRAGIHATYLSQLERGLKSPTLSVIYRIASSLDIALADLVSVATTRHSHSDRCTNEGSVEPER